MVEGLTRAFVVAAWAWAAALPLAAWAAVSNEVGPPGRAAAGLVYAAGGALCHQRPERSFHLHGTPLPVCARCVGLYTGAAMAGLAALGWGRMHRYRRSLPGASQPSGDPDQRAGSRTGRAADPRLTARLVMGSALLVNLATIGWEWTTGQAPANVVRALAGSTAGAGAAWIIVRAVRREQSG